MRGFNRRKMRFPYPRTTPMKPPEQRAPIKENDNCKIKMKRDTDGKIKELSFSGKCSKTEVDIAKQQLGLKDESE